jgi:hypothetical protein
MGRWLVPAGALVLALGCPRAGEGADAGGAETAGDAGCIDCLDAGPVIPPEWHCDPIGYGQDHSCECGCGALDPDCLVNTISFCNECICGQPDWSCPGFVDPDDTAHCLSPHGHPTPTYTPPADDPCGNTDFVFDPNEVYARGSLLFGQIGHDAIFAMSDPTKFAVGFGSTTFNMQVRADGKLVFLEGPGDDMPNHVLIWNRDWHVFRPDPQFPGCLYPEKPLANDEILPARPCTEPGDFIDDFKLRDGDATRYLTHCNFSDEWFDESGSLVRLPAHELLGLYHSTGVFLLGSDLLPESSSIFDPETGKDTPIAAFQRDDSVMAVRATPDGFLFMQLLFPNSDRTEVRLTRVALDTTATLIGELHIDAQYVVPFPTTVTIASDGRIYIAVFPPSGSIDMITLVVDVTAGTTSVAYDPTLFPVDGAGTFSGG